MAAVLACGEGAVLSHGSALSLWGIWKRWDSPFHVTVTSDRRPKGVRVHRVARLSRRDVTRHQGIPVTTLARAMLDQARHMRPKTLNRAINNGRLDHGLTLGALREVIARNPRHWGRLALEAVIGSAPERPSRSGFEDEFPAFCQRYGLPAPQAGATVCGYEVDYLFAAEKVIVELDGWDFHRSRTSFEGDRDRDADTAAAGYLTVRLTRDRFDATPDKEAARLHTILARRRGQDRVRSWPGGGGRPHRLPGRGQPRRDR